MVGLKVLSFALANLLPYAMTESFQYDLTISLGEKQILDKFHAVVGSYLPKEYMHEEVYLVRWLRARQWSIPAATEFLNKYLKWREENKMDGIADEDWSDMGHDFPMFLESRDKEGRPLLYIDYGKMDIRKAILKGRANRFLRYFDKTLEETCNLVMELGDKFKNVSQGLLMLNLDGFNRVQHGCPKCVSIIVQMFSSYENHHPGCAEKVFFVNTPSSAAPLYTAARAIMSKDTRDDMIVIGTNRKQLTEKLLKYFDRGELPVELGGTKIYRDPAEDRSRQL